MNEYTLTTHQAYEIVARQRHLRIALPEHADGDETPLEAARRMIRGVAPELILSATTEVIEVSSCRPCQHDGLEAIYGPIGYIYDGDEGEPPPLSVRALVADIGHPDRRCPPGPPQWPASCTPVDGQQVAAGWK